MGRLIFMLFFPLPIAFCLATWQAFHMQVRVLYNCTYYQGINPTDMFHKLHSNCLPNRMNNLNSRLIHASTASAHVKEIDRERKEWFAKFIAETCSKIAKTIGSMLANTKKNIKRVLKDEISDFED